MRVAFSLIGIGQSTGGHNYFRNLFSVLATFAPGVITPVLFVGTDKPPASLDPFRAVAGVEIVETPSFNDSRRVASLFRALLIGRDTRITREFRRTRIDLVFESAVFFGWRIGLPAVAFIPDLQHRQLRHLFSDFEWWRRELGFRVQVAAGRTIVVSSQDSCQSFEKFFPAARGRTVVLRFAVPQSSVPDPTLTKAIVERYGLPATFVFMPNQFWTHKNHLLVVRALELLRDKGTPIVVAATGLQRDPRNLAHAPTVLALVRELGLETYFRALGLIPYRDLSPIMHASTALLNPSLFEGWSTSVEEARSQGVPMILSDIAVHREQAGETATYFNPASAESLAIALAQIRPVTEEGRKARLRESCIHASARSRTFAEQFIALSRFATRSIP